MDFTRILDYFEGSPFEYLALDTGGQSLLLARTMPQAAIAVTATSVGTVAAPSHGAALPRPGERITRGQPLFTLRRFKTSVDVLAPCDGELAAVEVAPGQFAEYGQALAKILPQ